MTKISKVKTIAEAYAQTESLLAESAKLLATTEAIYDKCVPFEQACKIMDDGKDWNQVFHSVKAALQRFENDFKNGVLKGPATAEEYIVDDYNNRLLDKLKEAQKKMKNVAKRMEQYYAKNKDRDEPMIQEVHDDFAAYKTSVDTLRAQVEKDLAEKNLISAARRMREFPYYGFNQPIGGLKKDPQTKKFVAAEAKYNYIAEEFNEIIAWKKNIEQNVITRATYIFANIMDKQDRLAASRFDFKSAQTALNESFARQPVYENTPEDRKRFEKNDDLLNGMRDHHRNIFTLEREIESCEAALAEENAQLKDKSNAR